MRKLLALVLAMVMTLGLATVGTNAFTDDTAVAATSYEEAIKVLNGMGVFEGYPDGEFKPNDSITRAQVAAIIYRIATGDVKGEYKDDYKSLANFTDLEGAGWAAGYIGYCANHEFVKGYGNGKFGPNDPVTGYQACAMILRAVGYDQNHEFEGLGYEVQVASKATELGMLKRNTPKDLKEAASRAAVAQILFEAIQLPTVTFTPALSYNEYNKIGADPVKANLNPSLGWTYFHLTSAPGASDEWGRPTVYWFGDYAKTEKESAEIKEYATHNYDNGKYDKLYAQFDVDPLCDAFHEETYGCDVIEAIGATPDKNKQVEVAEIYENGVLLTKTEKVDGKDVTTVVADKIDDKEAVYGRTGNGTLVEIYNVGTDTYPEYRAVVIDTYLAKVGTPVAEAKDDNGHIKTDANTPLTIYKSYPEKNAETNPDGLTRGPSATTEKGYLVGANAYAAGDYILVNVNEAAANRVTLRGVGTNNMVVATGKADVKSNLALTKAFNLAKDPDTREVNKVEYEASANFWQDEAMTDLKHSYNWAFDSYGYVIGSFANTTEYMVLKSLKWDRSTGAAEAVLVDFNENDHTYTVSRIDTTSAANPAEFVARLDNLGIKPNDTEQTRINWNFGDNGTTSAYASEHPSLNALYLGYAMFRVEVLANGTVNLDGMTYAGQDAAEDDLGYNNQTAFIRYAENTTIRTNGTAIEVGIGGQYNNGAVAAYLDGSTKILVRSGSAATGYTYKAYTGTKDLPKFTEGTVDVYYHQRLVMNTATKAYDQTKYCDWVYIKNSQDTTRNRFFLDENSAVNIELTRIDNTVNQYWPMKAIVDDVKDQIVYVSTNVAGTTTTQMKTWLKANQDKLMYLANWNTNRLVINTVNDYDLVNEFTDQLTVSWNPAVQIDFVSDYTGMEYTTGGTLYCGDTWDNNLWYNDEDGMSYDIKQDAPAFFGAVSSEGDFSKLFKDGKLQQDKNGEYPGIWVVHYDTSRHNKVVAVYVGAELSYKTGINITSVTTGTATGSGDTWTISAANGAAVNTLASFDWNTVDDNAKFDARVWTYDATKAVGQRYARLNDTATAKKAGAAGNGPAIDDIDFEDVNFLPASESATTTLAADAQVADQVLAIVYYTEDGVQHIAYVTVKGGEALTGPAIEKAQVYENGEAVDSSLLNNPKTYSKLFTKAAIKADEDGAARLAEIQRLEPVAYPVGRENNKAFSLQVKGLTGTTVRLAAVDTLTLWNGIETKFNDFTAKNNAMVNIANNTLNNGGYIVAELTRDSDGAVKYALFKVSKNAAGVGIYADKDTTGAAPTADLNQTLGTIENLRWTKNAAGDEVYLNGTFKITWPEYAADGAVATIHADVYADDALVGDFETAAFMANADRQVTRTADEATTTQLFTTENIIANGGAASSGAVQGDETITLKNVVVTLDKVKVKYVLGSKSGEELIATAGAAQEISAQNTANVGAHAWTADLKLTAKGDTKVEGMNGWDKTKLGIKYNDTATHEKTIANGNISNASGAAVAIATLGDLYAPSNDYAYVIITKGVVPLTATFATAVDGAGASVVGGNNTKVLGTFMSETEKTAYATDAADALTISTPNAPVLGGNMNFTVKAAGDNKLQVYQYEVTIKGTNDDEDFEKTVTLTNGSAKDTGATFTITGVKGDIVINSITVAKASDLLTVKKVEVDATGFVLTITMSEAIENAPAKFEKTNAAANLIATDPITIDGAVVTIKVADAQLVNGNVFTVFNTLRSTATPAKTVTLANGTKGATGITITLDSTKDAGATFNGN